MTRVRKLAIGAVAVGMAVLATWPALAQPGLQEARLAQAPDGVLFVIREGIRHRVTPIQMSYADLGAIPESTPLPVGLLAPPGPTPTPVPPRVVVPGPAQGLSFERPIPLGWTCSCTIDRAGLVSQFDITVVQVLQDAYPFLQASQRFNTPPDPGNRYVGVRINQTYIRGPEDQAYTVLPQDYKATAAEQKLRDPSPVVNPGPRMEDDLYPGSTLNGWVFFEVPANEPVAMVWHYSFLGEQGVWFSLQ